MTRAARLSTSFRMTLALLLAVTGPPACSTSAASSSQANLPTLDFIRELSERFSIGPAFPETTKVELIDTSAVQLACAHVKIYSQVPAVELSLIQRDGSWHPLMLNKALLKGWKRELRRSLRKAPMPDADAQGLATDLTKILVDVSEDYGIVISSKEGVPLDMATSWVLRDMQNVGVETSDIRQRLLRDVTFPIHAPTLVGGTQGPTLVFYTWHFFGGELTRWEVVFGPKGSIKRHILATHVGSYGWYY